jgi:hypothetical protein
MAFVPSNSSKVVHIRKQDNKMKCGQSFSNREVSIAWVNEKGYSICNNCLKNKGIKLDLR